MAEIFEDFRIKAFLTVAQMGSFTLAAQKLGVSQPAISQNITGLEKSLGVLLLERRRGDIFLTDAGRAFKEYAEKIVYWYEAADKMFGTDGHATGSKPISIAADRVSADYILPDALSVLHASTPGASFIIIPYGEEADVQISVSPSPETMDFEGESRLVGVLDAAVVCSPGNRSVASASTPGEGRALPFSTIAGIHVSNSLAVWDRYAGLLSPDLSARVSLNSSSAEMIKDMVRDSGNLVGIVPYHCVRRELSEGSLVRLPVSIPEFAFDIHLVPSEEFAGKEIFQKLRAALLDCLQ